MLSGKRSDARTCGIRFLSGNYRTFGVRARPRAAFGEAANLSQYLFSPGLFVLKAMRGRIALLTPKDFASRKHFPHTGGQGMRNPWKNPGQFAESGVFSLFASNRAM
jgi:hypothetical protein